LAVAKLRLDRLLVERGLAATREKAQALIMAGRVTVAGRVVTKAGTALAREAAIELRQPPHPYVGRGGVKLERAIRAFALELAGKRALDVGASTGGFSHCLLLNGAAKVYAVDVGRGLIDARLRADPRIVLREGVNARRLDASIVPELVDVATIDVSFISVAKLLPAVAQRLAPGADVIVLVKPQFELERGEVGRGVVRDPLRRLIAIERVAAAARELGLEACGLTASPIRGAKGNREFLLRLRREPGWDATTLAEKAREVVAGDASEEPGAPGAGH